MALKGNLRDFSTTQLLNLINLARKSGTLTVEATEVAQVSFREGKLVYASMSDNGNGLAHVLEKSGLLTAKQGQIIQTRAANTGDKQLGHMLVRAGLVTQSDIIQSMRDHTLDVVYRLFSWAEGLFRFEAGQTPPQDRITVPIDLESVIMEGSRRMKEWARLQEELPDLEVRLRFPDQPSTRLRNISLTVEEWRVVSFVSPQNTLGQIAGALNLSEFQIRRIVYGMMQAGLVEIIEPRRQVFRSDGGPDGDDLDAAERRPDVKRSVITRLIDRIKRL
ncbi:MAG: DUF4388 domain-containing protein [Candidatus Promineifilaceae bacterium]|nr:DUF4388 domain-containing protein [Candidatus Promineifilaceae bacterium]